MKQAGVLGVSVGTMKRWLTKYTLSNDIQRVEQGKYRKKEHKKIVRKLRNMRNVRFSKFALFAEIAEIAIDDKHHTGRDSGTSRTSNSSRR